MAVGPTSGALIPALAVSGRLHHRAEDALKSWMMVERYPHLKEEVGGSIPGCEISSLLDIKLARRSTTSCAFGAGMSAFCLKKRRKKEVRL